MYLQAQTLQLSQTRGARTAIRPPAAATERPDTQRKHGTSVLGATPSSSRLDEPSSERPPPPGRHSPRCKSQLFLNLMDIGRRHRCLIEGFWGGGGRRRSRKVVFFFLDIPLFPKILKNNKKENGQIKERQRKFIQKSKSGAHLGPVGRQGASVFRVGFPCFLRFEYLHFWSLFWNIYKIRKRFISGPTPTRGTADSPRSAA